MTFVLFQGMIVWGIIVEDLSPLDSRRDYMSRNRIILVKAGIRLSLFLASMESVVMGPLGKTAYKKE